MHNFKNYVTKKLFKSIENVNKIDGHFKHKNVWFKSRHLQINVK